MRVRFTTVPYRLCVAASHFPAVLVFCCCFPIPLWWKWSKQPPILLYLVSNYICSCFIILTLLYTESFLIVLYSWSYSVYYSKACIICTGQGTAVLAASVLDQFNEVKESTWTIEIFPDPPASWNIVERSSLWESGIAFDGPFSHVILGMPGLAILLILLDDVP